MKELYAHIPQSVLPQEYGGQAGPFDKLAGLLEI